MTIAFESVVGVTVSVSDSPRWPINIEAAGEFVTMLSAEEAQRLAQILQMASDCSNQVMEQA